jgi:hypothetical protein
MSIDLARRLYLKKYFPLSLKVIAQFCKTFSYLYFMSFSMLKEWLLEYIFEYKIRIIYKALKMFKINKIECGILFIRLKFDSVCQHLFSKDKRES